MDGQTIFAIVGCLGSLLGVVSVAVTIPKVESHWKGSYWMGLFLALFMMATFGLGAAQRLGLSFRPNLVLYLLETCLLLTISELILVPFIHRWERKARRS